MGLWVAYIGEDLAVVVLVALVVGPDEGALAVDDAVAVDGEVVDVLHLDPVGLVGVEVAGAEEVAVEAEDDAAGARPLEVERAGEVVPRRDHDLLRPRRVARVLPRLQHERRAVARPVALRPQLRDVQRPRRHRRRRPPPPAWPACTAQPASPRRAPRRCSRRGGVYCAVANATDTISAAAAAAMAAAVVADRDEVVLLVEETMLISL